MTASTGKAPEPSKAQLLTLRQSGLHEWWWECNKSDESCGEESQRFIYSQAAVVSGYRHLKRKHGMVEDESF